MASEAELQFMVGELRGRVAMLEQQNRDMLITMRGMSDQLREIHETLSSAKGGWKTLMVVGGGAATLGGMIVGTLLGALQGAGRPLQPFPQPAGRLRARHFLGL